MRAVFSRARKGLATILLLPLRLLVRFLQVIRGRLPLPRKPGWLPHVQRPVRPALLRKLRVPRILGTFLQRLPRRRWLRSQAAILRARWSLLLRRPKPPRRSEVAPGIPRPPRSRRVGRFATTAFTAAFLILVGFVGFQQSPQLGRAVADQTYTLNPAKLRPTGAPPEATAVPPPPTAIPPTPWPTPNPLEGGGSVVFSLRLNGQSDIYALSVGQSQPVRLTHSPADDRDPAWNPTGDKIAFSSRRDGNWELYVLDLPTGETLRLTNRLAFDGGPRWSPDGAWLVFESYENENLDLYKIRSDGSQRPVRLTKDPAPDFAPTWSPDGRYIAFTSWRTGNKEIFLLDTTAVSDESVVNLTNSPATNEDEPAFNPSGNTLAYSESSSGLGLIYTLPLKDYSPAGQPVTRGQGRHPAWSPTGEALAYVVNEENQHHLIAGTLDAWSVAPQAFSGAGTLGSPDWSARTLPRELPDYLQPVDAVQDAALYTEHAQPAQDGPPYFLMQLPVNAPAPYLNDRVDESFLALRDRVMLETRADFLGQLDNMYELPDTRPLPGQPYETWNKAGRAFDYYSRPVLAFQPELEVVPENRGGEVYWRTFLRAGSQDGTQGEPLRELPWDFRARYGAEPEYYDQGGKLRTHIPSGYFVDFTELAADYGWQRVPSGDNWRTYFPAVQFWHYEKRQGLTWEEAMHELFRPEQLEEIFGQ